MNYSKSSVEGIRELIEQNQIDEALQILSQNPNRSPFFQNAQAVCLMRSGQADKAVEILKPLVYRGSSVTIDYENTSELFILNLVTAMLLAGNLSGAVSLLAEVPDKSSMRQKLQSAIDDWKRKQSFFSRVAFVLGMLPMDKPIPLDFPPGQL